MFTSINSDIISKKRTGVLRVFTKTIQDLSKLEGQTATQVEIEDQRIKDAQAEKAALLVEKKLLLTTIAKLNNVIGADKEPVI